MITYLYWIAIIAIASGLLYFIGYKLDEIKIAAIAALSVLLIGFFAYHFHFQQVFVKRYGGVMTIKVPDGELHLTATWKDDNLWIENYDPKTNICHFREYSRGALLQGKVSIKNCNPMLRQIVPVSPLQP
ncbi:MAG: hypothetical protein GQ572_04565 [Gammaproteobacteria bacterium]|jgi:hypothetical protein|nr:hypothetical protein [Gammaproteobacteria bacterium]